VRHERRWPATWGVVHNYNAVYHVGTGPESDLLMELDPVYVETRKCLSERQNGSLRQLARALDYPSAAATMLSHVLGGRWKHVSLDTLNELRRRLDLKPVIRRMVLACPSCGEVHGEKLDCHGQPITVVLLGPNEKIQTIRPPAPPWVAAAVAFLIDPARPRQEPNASKWAVDVKWRAKRVRELGGTFPFKKS